MFLEIWARNRTGFDWRVPCCFAFAAMADSILPGSYERRLHRYWLGFGGVQEWMAKLSRVRVLKKLAGNTHHNSVSKVAWEAAKEQAVSQNAAASLGMLSRTRKRVDSPAVFVHRMSRPGNQETLPGEFQS
jgi:hypothetical protein